ncbi:DUF1538 domain-containing protein [Pseudodesulfovibrio sp. F-1]|uniref:DUF1538 domain-containing protein n=1 Tax=Pseudodesulfovibrio alkaliphilus TaxID=2661613 RepID=A0A7K1KMR6_9BACT|nr:DUF1538 domain-containing protein [Pseudodesulfovibrio alkaliphilus]MUM77162.1 DUF1538 domain-containing protein [Pseudodesulfovibrio alkaliphilus]
MTGLLDFLDFGHVVAEVLQALTPLVLFFIFFQVRYLKLPTEYVLNMAKGLALCMAGLVLFLQGVQVGFMPVGTAMGEVLGAMDSTWPLIPIGFVLGLVATVAEPAVHILSQQVEKASSGSIKGKVILIALSLGVAVFVALGMAKIIYGVPIHHILIPGYLAALVMMRFCDPTFIAIAFDAGGVATGPMTVTFVLAVALGIASAMEGRDPILDGFGLIALVALAPILSVMALGMIVTYAKRRS